MLEPGIISSIRHKILRKRKKKYPTAKPSLPEYLEAKEKLKGIKCSGWNIEELEDIVAYFIKYNLIENTKEKGDNLAEWSRVLATAPWMANVKNQYYIKHLAFLIEKKVLEKKGNKLFLSKSPNDYEKTEMQIKENKSYDEVCEYIRKNKKKDDYITLKISAFHARSFTKMNSKNDLVKLIREFPRLKVEILCVGKHSGTVAKESATPNYLKQAIKPGMLRLYDLAFWNKNQFKIRIVKDNIVDASLRCTILMDQNNIEFCRFAVWRVGNERGIHANIYDAEGDSSMALQMNTLFDEAFRRGIPAKRNFEWILYMIKKLSYIAIVISIIATIQWLLEYLGKNIPQIELSIEKWTWEFITIILTIIIGKFCSWVQSKFIE